MSTAEHRGAPRSTAKQQHSPVNNSATAARRAFRGGCAVKALAGQALPAGRRRELPHEEALPAWLARPLALDKQ